MWKNGEKVLPKFDHIRDESLQKRLTHWGLTLKAFIGRFRIFIQLYSLCFYVIDLIIITNWVKSCLVSIFWYVNAYMSREACVGFEIYIILKFVFCGFLFFLFQRFVIHSSGESFIYARLNVLDNIFWSLFLYCLNEFCVIWTSMCHYCGCWLSKCTFE